ncbi:hypothetical protein [Akkermansia muciniphila]|jgi:hypothetical protein|uniref:hypothetical protein n=1 Tax=Akkermansia muciniphila TaxID=239935 RepID=UPI0011AF8210|nr:hypothetical protein [Akkermansia muciniphila]
MERSLFFNYLRIIFIILFLPLAFIGCNIICFQTLDKLVNFFIIFHKMGIGQSESFISLSAAFLTAQAIFEAPRQSLINWFIKRTIENVFRKLGNSNKKIKDILMSPDIEEELDKRAKLLTKNCKNSESLRILCIITIIIGVIYWIALYLGCFKYLGVLSILGFLPFFIYLYNVFIICRESKKDIIENIKKTASNTSSSLPTNIKVTSFVEKMEMKVEKIQNKNDQNDNNGCCLFRASCPHCPKNLS